MAGRAPIPTVPDINQPTPEELKRGKPQHRMNMQDYYRKEKQVDVMVSPMYQNYFGKVMPVTINGVTIAIPIDGKTYKLPETFVSEINRRRMAVDAEVQRADQLADISANGEQYPGAIKFG